MKTAEIKPEIVYNDFAKIDLRIGKIVEVQEFPRARNPSYKVAVEFAGLGTKWSSACFVLRAACFVLRARELRSRTRTKVQLQQVSKR